MSNWSADSLDGAIRSNSINLEGKEPQKNRLNPSPVMNGGWHAPNKDSMTIAGVGSNPTQMLHTLSPIKESEDNETDSLVNVTSPCVSIQ